jgi:FAD/FMN-containing dehydrogenase
MDLPCALAEAVATDHGLSDPELTSSYQHDYTGRYGAPARVVVRPADTQQVAGFCPCRR